jgi:GT2 family glycosyltransferase
MYKVVIGFTPRERFSLTAESLESIFANTDVPFHLIAVDCNMPARYRAEMDRVLAGRDNVTVIERDHYLLPNASRNLVIEATPQDVDFLCLIENDCIVKKGWLSALIRACEEHPADVAVPLIIEGPVSSDRIHFDDRLGTVQEVDTPEGRKLQIYQREVSRHHDRGTERRTVQFMEQHCFLFRRGVFDRIGLFDESLNQRDEIDISLRLFKAGVTAVFEPKSEINYLVPYPPEADETGFFFFKWDLERGEESFERLRTKWNLVEVPGDMNFIRERNRIGRMHEIGRELRGLIPEGEPVAVIDEQQWSGTPIVESLRVVPFPERDGRPWGHPADDAAAIEELERQRGEGLGYIAIGWPAYWWLDHYKGFADYLRQHFRCLADNDSFVVFDLRASAGAARQSAAS